MRDLNKDTNRRKGIFHIYTDPEGFGKEGLELEQWLIYKVQQLYRPLYPT
jgi:hypothetical protein